MAISYHKFCYFRARSTVHKTSNYYHLTSCIPTTTSNALKYSTWIILWSSDCDKVAVSQFVDPGQALLSARQQLIQRVVCYQLLINCLHFSSILCHWSSCPTLRLCCHFRISVLFSGFMLLARGKQTVPVTTTTGTSRTFSSLLTFVAIGQRSKEISSIDLPTHSQTLHRLLWVIIEGYRKRTQCQVIVTNIGS